MILIIPTPRDQISKESQLLLGGVPCSKISSETGNARESERRTFQVEVSRPVAFHMGDDALAAAVEGRVIFYADSRAGGVEVVERCG